MKKIVLIPGLLCDSTLWQPMLEYFQTQYHYKNISIGQDNSIEELAVEISKNKEVILIGFSLGARIALHSYFLAPQNVNALILISSAPGQLSETTKQHFLSYINKIITGKFEDYLEADFEQDISEKNKSNQVLKNDLLNMMRKQGPEVALRQLTMLLQHNKIFDNLHTVHCPTLLIRGEDDKSINRKRQEQIQQEIPLAKLITIANAAHYIPLENPKELAEIIEAFLEK